MSLLEIRIKQLNEKPKMKDHIDKDILMVLQEDCRLSVDKIAKRINIARGTVYNRLKKLEKNGFIKSYSAILDSKKLGYDFTALILLQIEGGSNMEISDELFNFPNVIGIYDITGEYDIAIIVKFKNYFSLNSFIKKISSKAIIKRTTTNIALNVIKEDLKIKT
jgi:DNA-binding Lrp family transcriptional regulator